jgi:hypothetical protein
MREYGFGARIDNRLKSHRKFKTQPRAFQARPTAKLFKRDIHLGFTPRSPFNWDLGQFANGERA